jgi:type II secretory pathway component GspD/PulD (secretin)
MNTKNLLLMFVLVAPFCFACIADAQEEQGKTDAAKKKNVVITYDPENREIKETIPFETLDYNMIKGHCEKMLSPTGYILSIPERKSIIVCDFKKNVEKIKELVKSVDRPAVNIRIDIGSTNIGSSPNDRISADINYPPPYNGQGKIIIEDGKIVKPKSINIDVVKGNQTIARNNSSFVVAQSGYSATLFAGREIVDPSWLQQYKLVPSIIVVGGGAVVKAPGQAPDIKWRNVGTYLKVRPFLLDNGMIDVEIYPEITYIDGEGKNQAVKVESVVTRLTVREGQTIPLGGAIDTHREFYSDFFGPDFRRTGGGGVLNMTLKASVVKGRTRVFDAPRTTDPSPSENSTGRIGGDGTNAIERGENPYQWRQ